MIDLFYLNVGVCAVEEVVWCGNGGRGVVLDACGEVFDAGGIVLGVPLSGFMVTLCNVNGCINVNGRSQQTFYYSTSLQILPLSHCRSGVMLVDMWLMWHFVCWNLFKKMVKNTFTSTLLCLPTFLQVPDHLVVLWAGVKHQLALVRVPGFLRHSYIKTIIIVVYQSYYCCRYRRWLTFSRCQSHSNHLLRSRHRYQDSRVHWTRHPGERALRWH